LNVRRELQQARDLRYPRLGDVAQFGQFRLVADVAASNQLVEVDG
jgi:hypothetical protein